MTPSDRVITMSDVEQAYREAVREVIRERVDWFKGDLNRLIDQFKERQSQYIGGDDDGELLLLACVGDVLSDRLEAEHDKPFDPEDDQARDLVKRLYHRMAGILGFHKRRVPKR